VLVVVREAALMPTTLEDRAPAVDAGFPLSERTIRTELSSFFSERAVAPVLALAIVAAPSMLDISCRMLDIVCEEDPRGEL
jgi:hypothetical protein